MKETYHLTNASQLTELTALLSQAVAVGEHVVEIRKRVKRRSMPQNSALHVYCEIMAELMNDAGYTQRKLVGEFKAGFELPVTEHMIKDIFREVGRAMFKKDSTSELTTTEIQDVYKIVDQRFSEVTGVRCDWPSSQPPAFEGVE